MYNFKNWVDRVTQFVNRFKETNNSDGSITHERVDGEVLKTGTSQSAANFNNMEGGILENSLYLCAMATPLSITPFGNVLAIQQNLSTGGALQTD